jgi:hypothetical protein
MATGLNVPLLQSLLIANVKWKILYL